MLKYFAMRDNMDTINFIREKQNELILMINSTFDELVREVEKINREEVD